MSKIFNFTLLFTFLLISAIKTQAADIGFEFGFGLDTSGDRLDSIERAYGTDSSGLGMFFELQAGMPIGIAENFLVKPKLSYLMGYVSVDYAYGEDTCMDSLLISGVAAEYHINGYEKNSFFVGAEIGAISASSDSDGYYELDSNGVSYGIYGGYNFGGGSKILLGYRSIPVEVTYQNGYKESNNFGGLSLQFTYTFWLK
ncbi:MAG: hypothetical protein LBI78_05195 [Campylobacteraceae bacterium]|nr:hypothetical protein [Campylobacteraceae bacterium]